MPSQVSLADVSFRLSANELIEFMRESVLQRQMPHADVCTTLRIYSHLVSETHRECMERIGERSIGTNVPIGTEQNA